jgi:hypothetical protein
MEVKQKLTEMFKPLSKEDKPINTVHKKGDSQSKVA